MKHFKRTNLYKASNVTFNPETIEAFSYDWWCFVKKINGKVIFNSYKYSPTTGNHQYKVRSLLKELNIKIDFEIECPSGFQSNDFDISIDKHYSAEIEELKEKIAKPRSQSRKNKERQAEIDRLAQLCVDFKIKVIEGGK